MKVSKLCGIAGMVGNEIDEDLVAEMARVQSHRGPDSSGIHSEDTVCLASQRLSIIDLSESARQPMSNESETVWLVFNGEIYNYVELRGELQGFNFRTSSDTEVLLRAYEKWGPSCVSRLNGMFAFAIWDRSNGRLFCARDHFGIKPFHYIKNDRNLIFSSEIKPLLLSLRERVPDMKTIYEFMSLDILDHSERTFFEGIRNLPPAHSLTYSGGKIEIRRYWSLISGKQSHVLENDANRQCEEFGRILRDSIRIRFRSDVPVGICLSGGIDSSSILSIARVDLGIRMHAFSALFQGNDIDESKYVHLAAQSNDAFLHACYPEPADFLNHLMDFLLTQEEPVGGLSVFAQWCVMKEANAHRIRVLLDGQGADEMLGGYPIFYGARLLDQLVRWRLRSLVKEYVDIRRTQPYNLRFYIQTALFASLPNSLRNRLIRRFATAFLSRRFKSKQILGFCESLFKSHLKNYMYEKMMMGLPALLHYEDRNSMRWSIESRLPYLDPRLVELSFSLPEDSLVRGSTTKVILRESVRSIVPQEITCRRLKIGFATPEKEWYANELLPFMKEVIYSESFSKRGIFRVDIVKGLLDKHVGGRKDHSNLLWRCVNLELWYRAFIDPSNDELFAAIRRWQEECRLSSTAFKLAIG